jgi:hypothetical protein
MKEMQDTEGNVFMKDDKPELFPLNAFLPPGADASDQPEVTNMDSAVYTTPIVANNIIYIANRNRLYAIEEGASSKPDESTAGNVSRAD